MTNLCPILHPDHHPNLSSGGLLFDERNWTTFQRALTERWTRGLRRARDWLAGTALSAVWPVDCGVV